MHAVWKIKKLQELSGTNAKKDFIRDNKNDEHFMFILKVAFDPFFVTNMKTLPELNSTLSVPLKDRFIEFKGIANFLRGKFKSSESDRKIKEFLEGCSEIEREVYGQALTKSLRVGASSKIINKAVPGFLKSFELMKAVPISAYKDEIQFPIGMEEKFDGVRCAIIFEEGQPTARTYNGKSLVLPTIFKRLEKILREAGESSVVLDGELLHKTRTRTSSTVNKIIKAEKVAADADQELEFVIFDILPLDVFLEQKESDFYFDRHIKLRGVINSSDTNTKITPAKSFIAHNFDEVEKLFNRVKAAGGEGIMLKTLKGRYEFKRSKQWIKIKGVYRTTLKIMSLVPGKGKFTGMLGAFLCSTSDGMLIVNVGTGLTEEERVTFNSPEMIGKLVEVQFNDVQKTKDTGEIFLDFPVFKYIREDKDKADSLEDVLKEIGTKYKK